MLLNLVKPVIHFGGGVSDLASYEADYLLNHNSISLNYFSLHHCN